MPSYPQSLGDQLDLLDGHLGDLTATLQRARPGLLKVRHWGVVVAGRLLAGHRLLAAGNGGSAAEAQHLTAELVGRYQNDRCPLSAIALHAETSSVTAIGNDYGAEEVFARQVAAHGRPGDVLVALSASGRSANLLAAVRRARGHRLSVWAMTGPAPNPLARLADDALCVEGPDTATIQEVHLVAVHAFCAAADEAVRQAQEARAAQEGQEAPEAQPVPPAPAGLVTYQGAPR